MAIKLARKLEGLRVGRNQDERRHSRDNEVDETIAKDELDKFGSAAIWLEKLVRREEKDKEVERHGINKGCSKKGIVGLRDDATLSGNPGGLEENTVKQH